MSGPPPIPREQLESRHAVPLAQILADARWALGVARRCAPRPLLALVAAVHFKGLVPAGLAVTFGGMIHAVSRAVQDGQAGSAPLAAWLVLGFVLAVVGGVAKIAERDAGERLLDELNLRLTGELLAHAATLDIAFFEDPASLDVLQRARSAPAENFRDFVLGAVRVVAGAVQVAALTAILVGITPVLLLPIAVLVPPYGVVQWRLASRRYRTEMRRTTRRRWSEYFVDLATHAASATEIALLGLSPLLLERFRSVAGEFRDENRREIRRSTLAGSLFVVLTALGLLGVFLYLGERALTGELPIGRLVVFGAAAARLRAALEETVYHLGGALEKAMFAGTLRRFFAAPPRPPALGCRELPERSASAVELDDVAFTYPGAESPALTGISLRIEPGEVVALVGENGAGKTTLVRLIARIHDPQTGRVLVDGVDVREVARAELHQRIAWALQDFTRFEATAAENLAFGDWRRLLDDRAEVERIAALTGVAPFVASLPQGWDTWLGPRFGRRDLSTGQWQRLAVARAFARPASLLILDEPTASLDARTEEELFRRFRDLARGRTAVLVSHRFSTVSMADRILVLVGGRIAESGSHEELLEKGGAYAELFRLHQRMA
jgi:ATP-binding cassette subfamily B protein